MKTTLLCLIFALSTVAFGQTTLSTASFGGDAIGLDLTVDDYGHVTNMITGTRGGDGYTDFKWSDYMSKFVIANGGNPVEIKAGILGLTLYDNAPVSPTGNANAFFLPDRFEDWTLNGNPDNEWHNIIEYENGALHVIGGVGYIILDPSPMYGSPYTQINPGFQFTNVGDGAITLEPFHYENDWASLPSPMTFYANDPWSAYDYDGLFNTSDDFFIVSSTAVAPYYSGCGFPITHSTITATTNNLLNAIQTGANGFDLVDLHDRVLVNCEKAFQYNEVSLESGQAVVYWLYPKPIKFWNKVDNYPTDFSYEIKEINAIGNNVFLNTDLSINYSALTYVTNDVSHVASTKMKVVVAEITGGMIEGTKNADVFQLLNHRYWEMFYDTRRTGSIGDITITYNPAAGADNIVDESKLVLVYRTNYDQPWTKWVGCVIDAGNNTITAPSFNLGDSHWALAYTSDPLPVELSSFSAEINDKNVNLNWKTATEIDNYGFEIERKESGNNNKWVKLGFVNGHGNSSTINMYSFTDGFALAGIVYQYRLRQMDNNGNSEYSNIVEVSLPTPQTYSLSQNYPNPFNPSTGIKYQIANDGFVSLKVYNLLGKEIAVLVNENQTAGDYNISFHADNYNLTSGIYLYELRSNDFVQIKKMMLLK